MKKIVLATFLAALGSASALAADLGPRAYTKAPMMAFLRSAARSKHGSSSPPTP